MGSRCLQHRQPAHPLHEAALSIHIADAGAQLQYASLHRSLAPHGIDEGTEASLKGHSCCEAGSDAGLVDVSAGTVGVEIGLG